MGSKRQDGRLGLWVETKYKYLGMAHNKNYEPLSSCSDPRARNDD